MKLTAKKLAAELPKEVAILLLLLACVVNVDSSDQELPELEIHYTFKPEKCERKAKVTDVITLHYKGTLKETGKEFDSR